MALTQVKTLGIAADAVTGAKVADDQIDSEHYIAASIDHEHLANDAVDADILADNSVGLAAMAHGTDGNLITFDASGAPAYVATGNDGQVLTSTGSGSPPAFEAIPASGAPNNLIINGAMNVAQRGTSSTINAYLIDRFKVDTGGHDEAPTQSQHTLTSSDTGPWAEGFRRSLHVENGNQTGGAGATDFVQILYRPEGQDINRSGWNFTDPNSKVTISYWVKSSVAQNFYGFIEAGSPTRIFGWETGSLTANTWTKVTAVIPGYASLAVPDTNAAAFTIAFIPFYGTGYTHASNRTVGSWYEAYNYIPDMTSTWWTTNDATFEITGVQLEVGSTASNFEHRSYGEELQRCLRYCQRHEGGNGSRVAIGVIGTSTTGYASFPTKVPMRTTPSISVTEAGKIVKEGSAWYDLTSLTIGTSTNDVAVLTCVVSGGHGMSALDPFTMGDYTDFTLNAEF